MNALDYLILEHETHRKLLDQCEANPGSFPQLRDELIHHVNIEEAVFYPNLLRVKEIEDTVREAWEEHNLIMQLLQELDHLSFGDDAWKPKFDVLKKILLMHINDEEEKLFPRIRERASHEFLCDVGEQMEVQKISSEPDEILYPPEAGSHKLV